MDTAPATDALDLLWTPEQREAGRERCREQARASALETVAGVPSHLIDDEFREGYAARIIADWLKAYDDNIDRAAAIVRAPEATGRERLARHLAVHTQHSAAVAIAILVESGRDVAAMPAGGERTARLEAMRRAALLKG